MPKPTKVAKWGHALAVRLPAALIEELGLIEGDEVTLVARRPGTLDVAHAQRHERSAEWVRTRDQGISFDLLNSDFSGELTAPGTVETPAVPK